MFHREIWIWTGSLLLLPVQEAGGITGEPAGGRFIRSYISQGEFVDISSWDAVKTFVGFISNQPCFTIKRDQKM